MKSVKLFGLAIGASLALSTAAFAQDVTIAVAGPMTGGESAFGRQMKNGAEQAIKDLNAAGGVLCQKIHLVVKDDACDPNQSVAIANELGGENVFFDNKNLAKIERLFAGVLIGGIPNPLRRLRAGDLDQNE